MSEIIIYFKFTIGSCKLILCNFKAHFIQLQICRLIHDGSTGACTTSLVTLKITFVGRIKCIGRMTYTFFKLHRSRSCNCKYE